MAPRPLIIGHRGASALAPENTISAFQRALADGADGFEFDVRLTCDAVPVVIHDATFTRTGNNPAEVSALTVEQCQRIEVGAWFNSKFPLLARPEFEHENLPTLDHVLNVFSKTTAILYLEMKCEGPDWSDLARAVVELVKRYSLSDRTVIESFHLPSLAAVKRVDQLVRTSALFQPSIRRPLSSLRLASMIESAHDLGANEVALHYTLVNRRTVSVAERLEMPCVVWTVDSPRWMLRATRLGLKGVITNNPAIMVNAAEVAQETRSTDCIDHTD